MDSQRWRCKMGNPLTEELTDSGACNIEDEYGLLIAVNILDDELFWENQYFRNKFHILRNETIDLINEFREYNRKEIEKRNE
jgi:hypothetical protein